VDTRGAELIRASWAGTVALAITAIGADLSPGTGLAVPLVVASLLLFVGGSAAMVWSYAIAVGRSRRDEIAVAGLYFLAGGAAPSEVRRALLGSFAAQCVIAFAAAAIRPFTAAAFALLGPVWGLGLTGLWAARHGRFVPRRPSGRPPGQPPRQPPGQPPAGGRGVRPRR
jgi:hypothetical protein